MQGIKKLLFIAVMAVMATAAVAPAHAQEDMRISVNVPFDFVLAKSTLRSGSYRVEQLPSGVVIFANADGDLRRYALTVPGGKADNHNNQPYLVFTRYGNVAFLSKVVFSANTNYDLPKTGQEKELIANVGSSHDLAMVIQPAQ